MGIVWGLVVLGLSLLCWGGQMVSWLAHPRAVRLKLTESEESVDPAYYAWMRGEAIWDSLTLWTMVVAAVLLVFGRDTWAYFGLVGGGMYIYFGGLGIATRLSMRKRRVRIGDADEVGVGLAFLAIWAVVGAITAAAAVVALAP